MPKQINYNRNNKQDNGYDSIEFPEFHNNTKVI